MKTTHKLVLLAAGLALFGLMSSAGVVEVVSDYLWFKELGFPSVFRTLLLAKWSVGACAALAAAAALLGNLLLARRWAGPEPVWVPRYDASELPSMDEMRGPVGALVFIGSLAAALILGSWAGGHWEEALRFLNAVPFGSRDPVLGNDIGFYVFQLPFYRFLYQSGLAVVLIACASALVTYVLAGRISFGPSGFTASPKAVRHISFLAGLVCLLVAARYQLRIYDLLSAQRAVAPGPGYTDLNALLPALKALRFVAVVCAVLVALGPVSRVGSILAGAALLAAGSLLTGSYCGLVQRFVVAPNEIVKETPYIRRAIEHTRKAYGIHGTEDLRFDPAESLTPQALKRNDLTVKNIRLWDHAPLLKTYSQLQEIRTYYEFLDVDNDRYVIDGEYRQVMLSPRELEPASLPSRIWINEHLTYTHGYGLTMGPVNRISREGLPEFFIQDIPPRSTVALRVSRPEIYYGEAGTGYAIVRTASKEFDYPSGDENIYSRYDGAGGVPAGGLPRKLLFALRFGELKILLSRDITPESRILYHRNIRERLRKAAPFLHFDRDAYLVVTDAGRLVWLVDAYTVTDRYPYSERLEGVGNYIRNAVKAAVDAYDGTVSFYMADPSDPIIRVYDAVFPGLLKPMSDMPADLRRHVRYPQDLFSIQAAVYATYHMTDPQVFYNKEDLWRVPEKGSGASARRMPPYYTIMKLASVGGREEFILMVPFTPARKENMIAWMAARCDEPNYGRLLVYNFPKQKLVYGPQQIDSRIDQDPEISKQLTLWNQGGSQVIRGSLLVIPIESSLIYVQPLYLAASGGGLPELKRVIVSYGNAIAMEEDLERSLMRVFQGGPERAEVPRPAAGPGPAEGLKALARMARERFERGQALLRAGDWAGYGEQMKEVERLIKRMQEAR